MFNFVYFFLSVYCVYEFLIGLKACLTTEKGTL